MAKVFIYSTPTCPYCQKVKQYFTEKQIEFTDLDVSVGGQLADEMVKKSGQMGVPVIVIDQDGKESVIVGFKPEEIKQVLNLS